MTTKLRLDDLPEVITVVDISQLLRLDIEPAREFCRKHRQDLKPFKVGRENRYLSSNFKIVFAALQKAQ